jgi:hypothetical protein
VTRAQQATLTQAIQQLAKTDRNKVIHVISDRDRWIVLRERAKRATRVLAYWDQAIDLARSMALAANGEVFVHRRDGTVQEWQVASNGHLETVDFYGGSDLPED